ncbi:MAG: ATP-binding protein, partial [Gammaproteobacteria bacterium]|nr:ATP-binding protein [Gammaproteobacteria bacterium]
MQKLKFQRELSEEELERLVEYTKRKEREPPLAFVGRDDTREEIIGQVEDRLKATDTVSRTFVIKGAPGCGKTSLLSQFKHDIANMENAYVVPIKPSELNEPALFLESFVSELVKGCERKAFTSKETTNKTTGEALFVKQEREWKAAMPSHVERLERKSSSIWKVLNGLLNLKNNPVFLLLVDEAQRTQPLQGTSENTIATELHLGETDGIKIIPVFAGLSDTLGNLAEVGVSVRSEVITLGALSEREAELVVWHTMDKLKIVDLFSNNDIKKIMQQCSIASEQWPRHLDQYLSALIKSIVANAKELEIDLDRVVTIGHGNRI